jgi:hypothetical protein
MHIGYCEKVRRKVTTRKTRCRWVGNIVRCTGDGMTGSSSDDSILLAVRLQPLLITLNHNAIAILNILQSLFILISSVLICIHNSLTAPSRTALVPIRFQLNTLHYGTPKSSTLKVSTSRVFLLAALTSNCSKSQLPSTPTAYYLNYQLLRGILHCTALTKFS